MPGRPLLAVLVLSLVGVAAEAAPRVPQIPVSGTALQAFFTSKGQAINVNTDQLDLQAIGLPAEASVQMSGAFGPQGVGSVFGVYNAGFDVPPLYQVFPGAATAGWYTVMSFRSGPTRLVVNLFDAASAFQGSTTYLAGPPDHTNLGFYLQQSPGDGGLVFFSQDARNGGARMLAYNSTGTLVGGTWLAWETGAGPGGDYADAIWLFPYAFAPVPVAHTNWGTLKHRFQ